ncbi:MAG: porin family protein [Bacteroidales bacterium]
MKKLIFFLLLAMFSFTNSFGQLSWGGKLGFNLSSQLQKDNNTTYSKDYKSKFGLEAGLYLEYGLKENYAVQLALASTSKGYKYEANGVNFSANLGYIELQPSFIYKHKLGNNSFYGNAGPYFTLLGGGTLSADKNVLGINSDSKTQSIPMGNDKNKDMLKSSDFGLNIGGGIEIENFGRLGIQYSLGLANLAVNTDNGATIKNSSLSLAWTYPINWGIKKK